MKVDCPRDHGSSVRFVDGPIAPVSWRGGCLTIGNFDGVHLGHAAVLAQARLMAGMKGSPVIVMTFHPHPITVLTGHAVPYIQPLGERVESLIARGADGVWAYPFSSAFAALTPYEFVKHILVDQLSVGGVVVGPDFHFGSCRAGTVEMLIQFGRKFGFQVEEIAQPVLVGGDIASSSRIRSLLQQGKMEQVEQLMGVPYHLSGIVVHGAGLGHKMGFPTANIVPPRGQLLPPPGVYAATIFLPDSTNQLAAVSLGTRPTFDNGLLRVEAHVLDFDGDLYGGRIQIWFRHLIRPEYRFENSELLVLAMTADLASVRDWFCLNPVSYS